MKNKHAAMEMSVGTIVTIVLLMTVLILGLVLVRTIFKGATENISSIDTAVKSEISKLFTEDDSRKIVLLPQSKLIKIQKGNQDYLGFAFAVRNLESTGGKFQYTVEVNDPNIRDKCEINAAEAEQWIQAGGAGEFELAPGDSNSQDPIWVRYLIPENAPPCLIRYAVNIKKDGESYGGTQFMDVKVEAQ